jgi:hypothetical protein
VQACPEATQALSTQQPPELQALPAQQGWVDAPQSTQFATPAATSQTTPLPAQTLPGQQGSPAMPQVWQKPPTHAVVEEEQVSLGVQQA